MQLKSKKSIFFFVCFVISIITVAAYCMDLEAIDNKDIINGLLKSTNGWGLTNSVCVIGVFHLYVHIFTHYFYRKDVAFLSALLAIFVLLGKCYINATGIMLIFCSNLQIAKSIIIMVGYAITFYCILILIINRTAYFIDDSKRILISYKKTYLYILICWLPYIIICYPGSMTYDIGDMMAQFLGYAPLTNHHPYFQTLFLGIFVSLGNMFGNPSGGMFLYDLLQVNFFVAIFIYMLSVLVKNGISEKLLRLFINAYAFIPVFPLYAILIGKNMNYSVVIWLLTILIFEMVVDSESFLQNKKKMALLFLSLIMVVLFRNEGLYVAIAVTPFLIYYCRKSLLYAIIISMGTIMIAILWNKVIVTDVVGAESGSVAEALSIPFMQTARTVAYYGDEMEYWEIDAIDNVLEFDSLQSRYLPETSDRVKANFNRNASKEELEEYFKVYLYQMRKHPITYLDAVLNKSYGYFYPEDSGRTKDWVDIGGNLFQISDYGYELHSEFETATEWLRDFFYSFRNIPFLGMVTSCGVYTWVMIISFFFSIKNHKNKVGILYIYVPAFMVLLTCIASPVNAYFRYELPIVFLIYMFIYMPLYVKKCSTEQ